MPDFSTRFSASELTHKLRQLVAVDEAGTISGAAEHIHLTQPSLSRSMRRLEADLGCELFDRARNSARPS